MHTNVNTFDIKHQKTRNLGPKFPRRKGVNTFDAHECAAELHADDGIASFDSAR